MQWALLTMACAAGIGCGTTASTTSPAGGVPQGAAAATVPRGSDATRGPAAAPPREAPTSRPAPSTLPFSAFPIATNCQAKLALTQEVTRLLTAAAAHSTTSAACVDGPGARVAATDILVCPAAGNGDDLVVTAYFRMAVYPEGDTRACGIEGRTCDHLTPTVSEHLVELRLETDGKGGARLRSPASLPGMREGATPLNLAHDGNCYGKSPPFVPAWITP